MSASLWGYSSNEFRKYNALSGDIDVDLLIVGGGFTGCSAALSAAQKARASPFLKRMKSVMAARGAMWAL